jgi:ribosomal protein S18 acetylase RimI-like enzyme
MPDLPAVGTRVNLRYRLPAGSVPPLTDVVGHLLRVGPTLTVRTKRGDDVDVAAADVVAIKALSDKPVRTGDIRNLEHAAALAWPGIEHEWLGGWLLRFGHGRTRRANSAVPLGLSIDHDLTAVIDWYTARGVPALIAAPDRLFRAPPGTSVDGENLVMTRELTGEIPARPSEVTMAARPDDAWLAIYQRDVPVDVMTAVVDGELVFATVAGVSVGRAAITVAPDGTRWAGLTAVHVVAEARGRGLGRAVCDALLVWAAEHGATRAYVQVLADNVVATRLYESMGFGAHHRSRYLSLG